MESQVRNVRKMSPRIDGFKDEIPFMVPDGMGLADVTAARIFKNGIDGAPLHFETLDHIGYQRTYSSNSTITDSAPAASAWACGEKFNNGEICFHADGRPHLPSILELAKRRGRQGDQQHGPLQSNEAGAQGRRLTQETGTSATTG